MFHGKLCTGCMQCVAVCRQGVHQQEVIEGKAVHIVDSSRCIGCKECLKVCCYDALSLVGEVLSTDQVCARLSQDIRYFSLEGKRGGVTLSGGEPMQYVPFIKELATKMSGVNFCMETSGYASRKAFEEVMPYIDLFLFDYKVTNPSLHAELCGADNALILENLQFLYESGKKIVLRLPMIPSLNDTTDHFDGIAALLLRYPKILRSEIMPYHVFGLTKTEELGEHVSPRLPLAGATDSQVETWLEELRSRGCTNICRS